MNGGRLTPLAAWFLSFAVLAGLLLTTTIPKPVDPYIPGYGYDAAAAARNDSFNALAYQARSTGLWVGLGVLFAVLPVVVRPAAAPLPRPTREDDPMTYLERQPPR